MAKVRIASPVRTNNSPLNVPRTIRNHDLTVLTSMPAGRMTPLAAIPLLREDSARVNMQTVFNMMETADMLMNEVNVTVSAYFVPTLAFDRFQSMDDLNRSYEGKEPRPGVAVVPYVETILTGSNWFTPSAAEVARNDVHRYLGAHSRIGQRVNTAYLESYNAIWNYRARNRSPKIAQRNRLATHLAPAFWHHSRFAHIVPDFDQATMDGNVALNVVEAKMPVRGLAYNVGATTANVPAFDGSGNPVRYGTAAAFGEGQNPNNWIAAEMINNRLAVFAELQQNGITVSLANIELARKTQAFAKLREQYAGHKDDYIIDMLMDGLTIPDQAWRDPILLQQRMTTFGMAQRYATNGADLTKSVVNGAAMMDLNFGVPKCPCGGVIMIVAEALPAQLFERGADPYLHAQTAAAFPQALRDMLDPEPVEAVRNDYIDVDHVTPASTFGYAPMNHAWNFASPKIGGRFMRPKADAGYNQDRERIWAVEQVNPILSEDFYISRNVHTKPFVNPNQDPFEVQAAGGSAITGNTQFGPALVEASNNYKEVMDEAPTGRLTKPVAPPATP